MSATVCSLGVINYSNLSANKLHASHNPPPQGERESRIVDEESILIRAAMIRNSQKLSLYRQLSSTYPTLTPMELRNGLPVARNIFGTTPSVVTSTGLEKKAEQLIQQKSAEWNFDFKAGKPLEGRYLWKALPSEPSSPDERSSEEEEEEKVKVLKSPPPPLALRNRVRRGRSETTALPPLSSSSTSCDRTRRSTKSSTNLLIPSSSSSSSSPLSSAPLRRRGRSIGSGTGLECKRRRGEKSGGGVSETKGGGGKNYTQRNLLHYSSIVRKRPEDFGKGGITKKSARLRDRK